MVRLPSREPIQMITPATPSAATASNMPSHGMWYFSPSHVPVIPRTTTNVLQTSVEKCSASASSASLGYFFATRFRARARTKSIPIVSARIRITAEAQANGGSAEEQPLKRFPDDVERGEEQQARLDERRKALHFSVAVEMIRVRRFVRHADGKIRDHRGDQIENRVQRFGENSQAACDDGENHLQRDEHHGRAHRAERRHALFARGLVRAMGRRGCRCVRRCLRRHSGDYTLRRGVLME